MKIDIAISGDTESSRLAATSLTQACVSHAVEFDEYQTTQLRKSIDADSAILALGIVMAKPTYEFASTYLIPIIKNYLSKSGQIEFKVGAVEVKVNHINELPTVIAAIEQLKRKDLA